jgi:hypothetical protein
MGHLCLEDRELQKSYLIPNGTFEKLKRNSINRSLS